MKRNKFNSIALVFILLAGLITVISCQKEDETFPRTRLFQPVLNKDLEAIDNTILVNLGKMKQAVDYTIDVSRDTFKTIDYSFKVDTNYFIINSDLTGEELLWFTIYQVRATAHADDSQYDSKPSDLGSVRTAKFPSNMGTPGSTDVLDTRVRVFWTKAGAAITTVKVFAGDDARLTTPLFTYNVSDDDREAQEKIIGGLTANTKYQVAIYSDSKVRGWEAYTTRPALELGEHVLDLTGIDTVVNLAAVLPDVVDGTVVVLEGGKTYNAGGYSFDKSISFVRGYSFVPGLPVIQTNPNFNITEGANINSISFKEIHLTVTGGFGGSYVFNIDKSGTVGEIKFESCVIRTLRGILRMKGGTGTLDNYTINNCKVDSINGYAIISVDVDPWMCNNILLQNSTFSKCQYFLVSRNNSNSVVIDGCTIHEAPEKGRQLFRWRTAGQDNVTNGITISNTIWGHGWNMAGETDYTVDGFDGLGSTNWTIVNTYTTGDFAYGVGKDEIPGFPSFNYSGTAADLWTDPYHSIFDFKDTGFAGKGDSGDPRWRIGL